MVASSVVHSNAFNFMSYLQNGVDPRTGQYTVSINFPVLNANNLRGPSFPLQLAFSPLNTLDTGFGKGWSLNLSQYIPSSKMLALSTGESFKVTGSGENAAIKERKIDSFHFSFLANKTYRIVHKSGLVEELKNYGSGDNLVALPHTIYAASGHAIYLDYDPSKFGRRLKSIRDEQGLLLEIDYASDNSIKIDIAPDPDGVSNPRARYELGLTERLLNVIVLPSDDKASWRLSYMLVHDFFLCLSEIKTPVGGRETIHYDDEGHTYPTGAGNDRNLPRVTRHMSYPGLESDPDALHTEYAYTGIGDQNGHNFLGAGAQVSWEQGGVDNLYKAPSNYTYSSTSIVMVKGKPIRTTKNTYNRFHLLIEELTKQNNCIQTVTTTYHSTNAEFDQQPPQFQLPKQIDTEWSLENDATRSRVQSVLSSFDEHGNPTKEVEVSGTITEYDYYPANGDGNDCPADPHGFVRNLKMQRVTPSADFSPGAHVLETHYSYKSLPAISGSDQKYWLVSSSESVFDLSSRAPVELLKTKNVWINKPDDVLAHGQSESQLSIFNSPDDEKPKQTCTTYSYSVLNSLLAAEPVVQTVQTVTGYDNESKIITLQYSLFSGQPVLTRDDNDIEILYTYDALQRVTSETVAPNDAQYSASRYYSYSLTSADNQRASQLSTNVKGVQTRSYVDGLNRPVQEERHDADNPESNGIFRMTYEATYNALGDMSSETNYDWRGTENIPLLSTFDYDDWGQQQSVVGPDNVRAWEITDPIGSAEWRGPIVRSWQESTLDSVPLRTGEVVAWMNLLGKVERVSRFFLNGTSYSIDKKEYDGLGRLAREINALNHATAYEYDAFNRMTSRTLPGGAIEVREYARHSAEDLPTLIKVNSSVLGLQEFDGLDRMTKSVTGGRVQLYTYEEGQTQPRYVTTPSLQTIEYKYNPQLGEEPTQRILPDEDSPAIYEYDPRNARMLNCSMSGKEGSKLTREYFSTGQLKSESFEQNGVVNNMTYVHSLQGLLLSYTDVLGQVQNYEYDTAGRIISTRLGDNLVSSFTYDGLGQTKTIATVDSSTTPALSVIIELGYDEFGREILRKFDLNGTQQALAQTYSKADAIASRVLSEGETLLRKETYEYEPRSRLQRYTCEGIQSPVDPYGQVITKQEFFFDDLDNITRVITTSGDITNVARYFYECDADPVQLTRILNTHDQIYPAEIVLDYDSHGNLRVDEAGRTLEYDSLNRLKKVTTAQV
ncbi:sugar-binding protein [Pseudomonas sp. CCC3.1]|uniref:RHS repeat domain-containing protein n=1 Tax=Pseudomonas sp. CCC3.1 TaxID=3048607 RepID=UPI002AC8EB76|nr:sugar-binding protein [Pseudomonas sp. CCC3.1]MEB0207281.1 sugar-binding protein [Pseudomonas sp. CCC3.1]WPX37665.1 sugar-binding protein [Pseudomonas sp. CCC3.1]